MLKTVLTLDKPIVLDGLPIEIVGPFDSMAEAIQWGNANVPDERTCDISVIFVPVKP